MASTYINHIKDYYQRVEDHPDRPNVLTIGDSWFQYPLRLYPDLQTRLSSDRKFGRRANILDDSIPGRDAREVPKLMPTWERVARNLQEMGHPFRAILLSLGGNDVIGKDFAKHLRDGVGSSRAAWPWNPEVPPLIRRWLDLAALKETFERIADAYRLIVALRDRFAPGATIVTHTYASVTPMNRPYKFAGLRTGPWIWKYAHQRGISDADQKIIVEWLLAGFHALLLSLRAETGDPGHFVVLDTRGELPDPNAWDNEIHPKGAGFIHLADDVWFPVLDPIL